MAKKKTTVNSDALLKNGMHVERTKQACLQGGMMLAYMCILGVFAYIVSMIPAGLFGVLIANGSTTNQLVYDIQNIVLAVIGLLICCIGGWIFAKKVGENDAMTAFRHNLDRKIDMRYFLISAGIAVFVYMFIGVVLNIDFFIGPIKYLGIFFCRAERSINEGIKVPFIHRLLAMLVCMALDIPMIIKGMRDGFKEKMKDLEFEEKEESEKFAAQEEEKAGSESKN